MGDFLMSNFQGQFWPRGGKKSPIFVAWKKRVKYCRTSHKKVMEHSGPLEAKIFFVLCCTQQSSLFCFSFGKSFARGEGGQVISQTITDFPRFFFFAIVHILNRCFLSCARNGFCSENMNCCHEQTILPQTQHLCAGPMQFVPPPFCFPAFPCPLAPFPPKKKKTQGWDSLQWSGKWNFPA